MSTECDLLILGDESWLSLSLGEDNGSLQEQQRLFTTIPQNADYEERWTQMNETIHHKSPSYNDSRSVSLPGKVGKRPRCFRNFLSSPDLCEIDKQQSIWFSFLSRSLLFELVRKKIGSLKQRFLRPIYRRQMYRKIRDTDKRKFEPQLNFSYNFHQNIDDDNANEDEDGGDDSDGAQDKKRYATEVHVMPSDFYCKHVMLGEKDTTYSKTATFLDKNTNANVGSHETSVKTTTSEDSRQLGKAHLLKNMSLVDCDQQQNESHLSGCTTYVEFANNIVYTSQGQRLESQLEKNDIVSKIKIPKGIVTNHTECLLEEENNQQSLCVKEASVSMRHFNKGSEWKRKQSAITKYAEITERFFQTIKTFRQLRSSQVREAQEVEDPNCKKYTSHQDTTRIMGRNKIYRHPRKKNSSTSRKELLITRNMEYDSETDKQIALDFKQITMESSRLVYIELNKLHNNIKYPKSFSKNMIRSFVREQLRSTEAETRSLTEEILNEYFRIANDGAKNKCSKQNEINELVRSSGYFKEIRNLIYDKLQASQTAHTENVDKQQKINDLKNSCSEMSNECTYQENELNFDTCSNIISQEIRRFIHEDLKTKALKAITKQNLQKVDDNLWSQNNSSHPQFQPKLCETPLYGSVVENNTSQKQPCDLGIGVDVTPQDEKAWRLPSGIVLSFLKFGLELHRNKISTVLDTQDLDKNPRQALLDLMVNVQACVDLCEKFFLGKNKNKKLPKYNEKNLRMSKADKANNCTQISVPSSCKVINKEHPFKKVSINSKMSKCRKCDHSYQQVYKHASPIKNQDTNIQLHSTFLNVGKIDNQETDESYFSSASENHQIIYKNVSSNRPSDYERRGSIRESFAGNSRPSYIENINTEENDMQNQSQQPQVNVFEELPMMTKVQSSVFSPRSSTKMSSYRIRTVSKNQVTESDYPQRDYNDEFQNSISFPSPEVPNELSPVFGDEVEEELIELSPLEDRQSRVPMISRLSHAPCKCRDTCRCGASIIRRASMYLPTRTPYESKRWKSITRTSQRPSQIRRGTSLRVSRLLPSDYQRTSSISPSKYGIVEVYPVASPSFQPRVNIRERVSSISPNRLGLLDIQRQTLSPPIRPSINRTSEFLRQSAMSPPNYMPSEFQRQSAMSPSNYMPSEFQRQSAMSPSNYMPSEFQRQSAMSPSNYMPSSHVQRHSSISPSYYIPPEVQIQSAMSTLNYVPPEAQRQSMMSEAQRHSAMSVLNYNMPQFQGDPSKSPEFQRKPSIPPPSTMPYDYQPRIFLSQVSHKSLEFQRPPASPRLGSPDYQRTSMSPMITRTSQRYSLQENLPGSSKG